MKNLSPIQKLDEVLMFLATKSDTQRISFSTLITDLSQKYSTKADQDFSNDIDRILGRLLKDEYIGGNPNLHSSMMEYFMTFDGMVFYEQGGYKRQEQLKLLEYDKLLSEKQFQVQQAESIRSYTKWIVVATIVAGLYYLKELLVWLFHVIH